MENQTTTDGFAHEIDFWKWFVESDRFLLNWVRPNVNPEIRANHPDVAQCFDNFYHESNSRELAVLDVGSGALPWIKGIIPAMNLVACDPLAEEYEKIFDYKAHGQISPVKAFAESLPFDDNSFDIVHCSNALDHTQNPYKAILEMERVCRPGGMILIQGFENEAINENWQGLHQWNIRECKTHLEIRSKEDHETGSVLSYLDHKPDEIIYANTTTIQTGPHSERNWFVFAYKNQKQ
jgi:ubiquinone/menaquinone biosynthesis C-methylase UbiE